MCVTVRGVIISIDGQHTCNGDTRRVRWYQNDGLLLVSVRVLGIGYSEDNVQFAVVITGATDPPFLVECQASSR